MIIVRAVTAKLTASLRAAPATVPALGAVALFLLWASDQGGFPVTHWAPGGLVVLALLGVALGAVRLRLSEVPLAVRIALLCLAGYTALSFLSILWAAVPGDAWEGANRTLLYLIVFALFACWRQHGESAALLLCVWTLAMVALAAFTALHLDAASSADLPSMLPSGRLTYPSGYANANAAQWLMAFWPAVLLARSERLPWGLRGLLAGGAVLLAEVALLSQSRGSLYATPVMLVLVFVLLPGRTRTFAVLVAVAAGIAVASVFVLRVGDRLHGGLVVPSTLHSAITTSFVAAAAVALVVALGAAVEGRAKLSQSSARRVHRGIAATGLIAAIVVVAGGVAVAGNPVTRIRHGWDTFKGGYAADSSTGSRLVSGLGSNRYDFYRVALDEFVAHPLLGIGADNFQQQYLVHGHSEETPHYPHSVELRTLAETGLIGALLALVGLAAALVAAVQAMRASDPLGRSVAAAALAGFGYWVIHGSFDWFWEFAGLGAPAFALLGLVCALAPARRAAARAAVEAGAEAAIRGGDSQPVRGVTRRIPLAPGSLARRLAIAVGVLTAIVAAVSLAAPWLSQLQVEHAARIWTTAPQSAYDSLDEAASLNPLSDEPNLVAGSIALRYGELARADHQFSLALARTPGDAYATLARGAIASTRGQRAEAIALLERAARLNPRDPLTRQALRQVRGGHRVDVEELNRLILRKANEFA
jgi:tetratricopeptide (TPR) repeat protein